MKSEKNTRLLYNDDKHIAMYKAMPAEQFKEFMIALLEYKYGDEAYIETIQDPMVKALFISEKVQIDKNEEKWEEKRRKMSENGKKGGRPAKQQEYESVTTNFPNNNEENDTAKQQFLNAMLTGRTDEYKLFEQHYTLIDPIREKAARETEEWLKRHNKHISLRT